MSYTKSRIGAVLALGLVATPAFAEPYYYHQPGIDREQYAKDVAICRDLAGMGEAKRLSVPYSTNIYATMAGAFLGGFLNSREQRRHEQAIERTCMADKSYTRVSIHKKELKRIRKLESDEARIDALFVLAAAPEPVGEELPE